MNLCHQLLFISITVIVTITMKTHGRLIKKLTSIRVGFFCIERKTFLISSQVDKEVITKHINTTYLRPPDELYSAQNCKLLKCCSLVK